MSRTIVNSFRHDAAADLRNGLRHFNGQVKNSRRQVVSLVTAKISARQHGVCTQSNTSFARSPQETQESDPLEVDWKRLDRTTLKARLSGGNIHDDNGNFACQEVIAIDITEQRLLETQLRH
jgi:hypothetical protein